MDGDLHGGLPSSNYSPPLIAKLSSLRTWTCSCMYVCIQRIFICQLRWPGGDAVACPPADMHAYIPIELPPNSSPALNSASEWLKHSSCLPAYVIRVCLEYTTSVHKKCNSHFMRNQIVSNLTNLYKKLLTFINSNRFVMKIY